MFWVNCWVFVNFINHDALRAEERAKFLFPVYFNLRLPFAAKLTQVNVM